MHFLWIKRVEFLTVEQGVTDTGRGKNRLSPIDNVEVGVSG